MSLLTIDNRPANPLMMLVDDSTWTILSAVELQNTDTPLTFINTAQLNTPDFNEVLSFLQTQTLTKTIVLTGQQALDMLPFIADAYTNKIVPPSMHFALQASVQGYNGNANVNKVRFTDAGIAGVSLPTLANATSITLTISP
jgi:hypothetical protein